MEGIACLVLKLNVSQVTDVAGKELKPMTDKLITMEPKSG
jgi:hypothetical protein